MNILCNGNKHSITEGMSIQDLFEELNLSPDSVVAEINRKIVQPDHYGQHKLKDGDQVELIRFVGGG